jgi:hypothetical protein
LARACCSPSSSRAPSTPVSPRAPIAREARSMLESRWRGYALRFLRYRSREVSTLIRLQSPAA